MALLKAEVRAEVFQTVYVETICERHGDSETVALCHHTLSTFELTSESYPGIPIESDLSNHLCLYLLLLVAHPGPEHLFCDLDVRNIMRTCAYIRCMVSDVCHQMCVCVTVYTICLLLMFWLMLCHGHYHLQWHDPILQFCA